MLAWILILSLAVFMVATSSIAIECFNSNKDFSDKKKSNRKFISAMLWTGVAGILLFFIRIFASLVLHI